jgi:hypothetical protein
MVLSNNKNMVLHFEYVLEGKILFMIFFFIMFLGHYRTKFLNEEEK